MQEWKEKRCIKNKRFSKARGAASLRDELAKASSIVTLLGAQAYWYINTILKIIYNHIKNNFLYIMAWFPKWCYYFRHCSMFYLCLPKCRRIFYVTGICPLVHLHLILDGHWETWALASWPGVSWQLLTVKLLVSCFVLKWCFVSISRKLGVLVCFPL